MRGGIILSRTINIGNKTLENGRTYIIAEAGSNHDGSLKQAKELIKIAAEANCDAVKFQTFKAEHHYSKHTPDFTYLKDSIKMSTYELIKSLEINRDWHAELIAYAQSMGIAFLSSPCDQEAVVQLDELGMPAFKLASFDITDIDLIEFIALRKKPLIISTGMANMADIERAVQACHVVGNYEIVLLQCTSIYPAPAYLSNLNAMDTMKKAFNCAVGYSDHTLGDHIAIAAVAMGAAVIEKHFTINNRLSGPDHQFALNPDELAEMVVRIRETEKALGDGIKNGPREEEEEMYIKGRRSIHCRTGIKAGEIITKEKICIKRPSYGISPLYLKHIMGMKVCKDIAEDYWLTWEDLK